MFKTHNSIKTQFEKKTALIQIAFQKKSEMETSVSKITEKPATRRSHRLLAPISGAMLPDSQEPVLRTIFFDEKTGKEQIVKIRAENISANELKATKVRFPKMLTMSFLRELADSFKYSV